MIGASEVMKDVVKSSIRFYGDVWEEGLARV